jgi:hypothetical protein
MTKNPCLPSPFTGASPPLCSGYQPFQARCVQRSPADRLHRRPVREARCSRNCEIAVPRIRPGGASPAAYASASDHEPARLSLHPRNGGGGAPSSGTPPKETLHRWLAQRDSIAGGRRYSITSSTRITNDIGTSSPSVFAVLALMTSSNFVGCWTGNSAGLPPLNPGNWYFSGSPRISKVPRQRAAATLKASESGDFYDLAFIRACMPEIAEAPELARCQPTKGTPDSQPAGEF